MTPKCECGKLIQLYDEYLALTKQELDELALIATTHGWESNRYEAGKKFRGDILRLKEKLGYRPKRRKTK